MSEQMHTYECPRCDYNVMGPNADGIADARTAHEDHHAYADEFAARNTRTYTCPLRCCDFTLTGVDIQAGIDEHEAGHLADVEDVKIVVVGEANILEDHDQVDGVRLTLDRVDTYGRFGQLKESQTVLSFDKPTGSINVPGIDPARIPELILELERLHGIWERGSN